MPRSKQAIHFAEQSLKALKELAVNYPLVIEPREQYNGGGYTVYDFKHVALTAGRYQVVHTFILGFIRGWETRGWIDAVEPLSPEPTV